MERRSIATGPWLLTVFAMRWRLPPALIPRIAGLADGTVMSWGSRSGGAPDVPLPTLVPGAQGIRAIAAGVLHVVALTESGTVMTWGDNTYISWPEATAHPRLRE